MKRFSGLIAIFVLMALAQATAAACNTPMTSTAKDARTGEDVSTSQIAKGDRGRVWGDHPLALLGHTLGGP